MSCGYMNSNRVHDFLLLRNTWSLCDVTCRRKTKLKPHDYFIAVSCTGHLTSTAHHFSISLCPLPGLYQHPLNFRITGNKCFTWNSLFFISKVTWLKRAERFFFPSLVLCNQNEIKLLWQI